MINKDSKQELDEVVAQAALQQTESQKQAQALAPGAVQQQDKPSFFNVSPFNDYRMEGLRMDPPKELCPIFWWNKRLRFSLAVQVWVKQSSPCR